MIALALSPLGRVGLAALGVVAFLSWFAFDQRQKGAANAVAKVERATSDVIVKAQSAGNKSVKGSGERNPHYRD